MAWTQELKDKVVALYLASEPTAENSTELVKEIAESVDQSPNGVRQVLVQANVYVKKEVAAKTTTGKITNKDTGEGTKRVSKETQIDELRKVIEAKGATVDEDILSKLTGKAAAYFITVLSN